MKQFDWFECDRTIDGADKTSRQQHMTKDLRPEAAGPIAAD
jgi:hypothetical protein